AAGLERLEEARPEKLSANELRDDLRWFQTHVRRLEALSARWLGELDRREQRDGGPQGELLRCSTWLADALKLTPNAAYAQVRTARALASELHLTAAAFRRGEISSRHVDVIRQAMEQVGKTCLEPGAVESELVFVAQRKDPFELAQHWKQM